MSTGSNDVLTARQEIQDEIGSRTLVDALRCAAEERADHPAYSDKIGIDGAGWRTLTWHDLRETALDVAAALVEVGVAPGDRVAIMASNRIEHVVADIAAVHAGATPMSIYSTFAAHQVSYVAAHSEPSVIVVEGLDQLARWQPAIDASSTLRAVVVLDPHAVPDHPTYVGWDAFLRRGKEFRARHAEECEARWRAIVPDQPATILYTSGTTGDPKGVVVTHHNVLFESLVTLRTAGAEGEIVLLSYLPYAHIAERILSLYIPQVTRAHVHLVGDAKRLADPLGEVRPTHFFGVPRVWEKIQTAITGLLDLETDESKARVVADAMATGLEYVESQQTGHRSSAELTARFEAADAAVLAPIRSLLGLERVEWAGSAAAPLPLETAKFFARLGLVIYDVYGLTETCGSATACGPDSFKLGTVGRPQPGIETSLAEDAEILVRGPITSPGYYRRDDATAELIDADGWVHTGDVGELDEDGFITIVGRKKEMIITSSGKNIAPGNIESLLKECPLVDHALAFGEGQPYIVAVLSLDREVAPVVAGKLGLSVTSPTALAQAPEIQSMVRHAVEAANARLSRPEQVKRWVLLSTEWTAESTELTPTLKLRRRVVHDKYAAEIAALYA